MLMVWSHSSDRHLWAVHWVLSLLGCLGTHHLNLLSATHTQAAYLWVSLRSSWVAVRSAPVCRRPSRRDRGQARVEGSHLMAVLSSSTSSRFHWVQSNLMTVESQLNHAV